ncbi:diphosphomevalonate decarboxylase-like [Dysidea avara]|uniref:diphosphomevalonate decarboxylase-like n=1 Tax=Dysidea avara TaxID=196820 RepID=UPI00332AA7E1
MAKVATCTAPVNIAVIKYWGKRDQKLILPVNASLSATLSQSELKAMTTVAVSKEYESDRIWLNGKEESISNPRLQNCLRQVRALCTDPELATAHVHICSNNSFPTAAGLASSAAGYACLVYCLAKVFNVKGDLSVLARQGSGSACRSMYGGFVRWDVGVHDDGSDSIAVQVAPATHWPEMEILVLVVSDARKEYSSTTGMQASVETSELLKYRAQHVVPARMAEMETAIHNKDFQTFAKLTMQDSNQFHAICLDTYPPITYMNDTSRRIISLITKYNSFQKEIKVAYSYDAGPNAVLFVESKNVPQLLSLIKYYFPPTDDQQYYFHGFTDATSIHDLDGDIISSIELSPSSGALKYIIHTKVGEGPQLVSDSQEALIGSDGLPK